MSTSTPTTPSTSTSSTNPWKKRFPYIIGFSGLLIGIFGAFAIYGVYAKIEHWPGYEFYMKVGFMGEMGALLLMGLIGMVRPFLLPPEKTKEESLTEATDVMREVAGIMRDNASAAAPAEQPLALDTDAGELIREHLDEHLGDYFEHMGAQAESLTRTMANTEAQVSGFGERFERFSEPLPPQRGDGAGGKAPSTNGTLPG